MEQQTVLQVRKTNRKRTIRIAILIVGLVLMAVSITCTILQFLSPAVGTSISTGLPIVVALLTWLYPFPSDTADPPETIPSTPQPPLPPQPQPSVQQTNETPIFHIPYRPNPFFTGREQLLAQLHNNLTARKATALTQPQAIIGLGGIGKTQVAIEYAYRHREDYHYIFWVNADKRETLIKDYADIAKLLKLPEKNEQDQNIIVAAAMAWLATHNDCLLILDNADDLHMINPFIPAGNTCRILITTRTQATNPLAQSIEVEKMVLSEGTLMLLRRAHVLSPVALLDQATGEEKETAEKIVLALDGLPLALDQAGAYIEETACTLPAYLQAYQNRQIDLLKRRGTNTMYHSDPVATTWSLSFEKVEQHNPLAADLMHSCAFLALDAIPEEFFTEGAKELSPLLHPLADDPSLLDEAIGVLRLFSLVRRNSNTGTLSIHRLVQTIIRINMNETTQKLWAERVVRMINHVFPEDIDITTWKQCQRYVAHVQTCASFIEHYHLAFPEAAQLLNQTAYYLYGFGLYTEAEPLLRCALRIREQVLGLDHPDTAISFNNLAGLYDGQAKYEQAELLYLRAIAIDEKALDSEHPDLAIILGNLAALYQNQGKYEQAEPLYQRALQIMENRLGSGHPNTVTIRENYALFLEEKAR